MRKRKHPKQPTRSKTNAGRIDWQIHKKQISKHDAKRPFLREELKQMFLIHIWSTVRLLAQGMLKCIKTLVRQNVSFWTYLQGRFKLQHSQ